MANVLDLVMLICGCVAAMAFGILSAFLVLRGMFWVMRPQRQQVAVKPQPEAARVS